MISPKSSSLRLAFAVVTGTAMLSGMSCGGANPVRPTSGPQTSVLVQMVAGTGSGAGAVVEFPPRNEPFDFRNQLEAKYRDQMKRAASTSYVDIEGDIVWTQEYLRYRVNECSHAEAVNRVFMQIDGFGIQPVCGTSPSGVVSFPPRNEPYDFRLQLEAKYRDQLRRSASTTYVDIEGDIVWTQEYLRYRVNACAHAEAVQKVMMQIDGLGIQPVCAPAGFRLSGYVTETGTGARVSGALATIDDGPNAGKSATTDGNGYYSIAGLVAGRFTLRVSKSGYNQALTTITIDGDTRQDLSLRKSSAPPPNPTCNGGSVPPSASCGTPTARCNDGTWSCSQNRSGTCSSHGGVSCWVCPGTLCNGVTAGIAFSGTTESPRLVCADGTDPLWNPVPLTLHW